jgi:glycosyltransferase involved in cell wall biosynthesis
MGAVGKDGMLSYDGLAVGRKRVVVKEPLLSICIPAYNRPVWLRRGLESITFDDRAYTSRVEVIITDDSDHRACEIIAGDVLEGWDYSYEHHERPLGMAQNWNRAIALARGQYVMVLHDDNFFGSVIHVVKLRKS